MEINREDKDEILKIGKWTRFALCSLCICIKFCYI